VFLSAVKLQGFFVVRFPRWRAAWRERALPTNWSALSSVKASYSQFGEDAVVMAMFRGRCSPGYYVDVGCFHPTKWSNTYAFYLRGWRGLAIDPNPAVGALWSRLRPCDTFLNFGVSDNPGTAL
jgi:hypothetical protein